MTKMRWIMVLLFVVAFAAGACAALASGMFRKPVPHGPSWLTAELNLDAQQQQEMLKIWGSMDHSAWQDESDRRKGLQKQRDEAIRALVPVEKKTELDKVLENYSTQMAELSEQRHRRFAAAVEKTKAILTSEQRKKYEEILARRSDGRRPWGVSRDGAAPTTAPVGPPSASPEPPPPSEK